MEAKERPLLLLDAGCIPLLKAPHLLPRTSTLTLVWLFTLSQLERDNVGKDGKLVECCGILVEGKIGEDIGAIGEVAVLVVEKVARGGEDVVLEAEESPIPSTLIWLSACLAPA